MGLYFGEFETRDDVLSEFGLGADFTGTILAAGYETGSYDGQAFVIFVDKGQLWINEASHCSCYGLEECWDPTSMPVEAIERILDNSYTYEGLDLSDLREALVMCAGMVRDGASDDEIDRAMRVALKFSGRAQ